MPIWNPKRRIRCALQGLVSAGARAAEHLRTIAVELQMAPTRTGVHIQGADFMATWREGKSLTALTHLEPNVKAMLDELVWWANALKAAREKLGSEKAPR